MTTYHNDFLNVSSFEPCDEVRAYVGHKDFPQGIVTINGSVEVTLWGETRRVPALLRSDGRIMARGMVGRYVTGQKSWPAFAEASADGKTVSVNFGRDDRSGRFNKANCLHFAQS